MNSTIVQPDGLQEAGQDKAAPVFKLDPANGVPIYRQIIRQIEYAILSKRMVPGDKLPTIRSLAVELKTNPNTIAKAYGELEIRGILITQVGSGTFISDKKPEADDGRETRIAEVLERFIGEMKALGVEKDELVSLIQGQEIHAKTQRREDLEMVNIT